jgi:hypothetical protein
MRGFAPQPVLRRQGGKTFELIDFEKAVRIGTQIDSGLGEVVVAVRAS